MKKTDDIRVWAYSSRNGKEISKFFIDGSMGDSDYTNLVQIKKSMLNRIPQDYFEKKIIINIHNLTSGCYNTYIVKNPNEKLLSNSYNTGRSWSQDHKKFNKAENYERVPALRKTKASNVQNLQEKKIVKKYTIFQLKKLASNYAYVTSGDLEKLTYRLLDKTYQSKLIPVYEKAIKNFNLKNPNKKV